MLLNVRGPLGATKLINTSAWASKRPWAPCINSVRVRIALRLEGRSKATLVTKSACHLRPQVRPVARVPEVPRVSQQSQNGVQPAGELLPDWGRVLVVVEGLSDLRAVQRAVPAQVRLKHKTSQ